MSGGWRSLVVAALLVVLIGVACSDDDAQQEESAGQQSALPAEMSDAQRQALADGEVTFADYEAGMRRFISCMAEEGYEVLDRGRSGHLFDLAIPDSAVQAGVDEECYLAEWAELDRRWQVANLDDSPTADFLAACLESHGIDPPSTFLQLEAKMDDEGIDPLTCMER